MIVVTSYVWYRARFRENQPRCNRWGPFIITITAAFLIMLDPTRQFVLDHVDYDPLSMYVPTGCDTETLKCLSAVGWVFTITTWVGFVLLMWGTMWNANLLEKLRDIRDKWREIRAEAKANAQDHYEPLPSQNVA